VAALTATVEISVARIGIHASIDRDSVHAGMGDLAIKTGNAVSLSRWRYQDGAINLERLDRPSARSM
jgi:hypothetical protein